MDKLANFCMNACLGFWVKICIIIHMWLHLSNRCSQWKLISLQNLKWNTLCVTHIIVLQTGTQYTPNLLLSFLVSLDAPFNTRWITESLQIYFSGSGTKLITFRNLNLQRNWVSIPLSIIWKLCRFHMYTCCASRKLTIKWAWNDDYCDYYKAWWHLAKFRLRS